MSRFIVTEVDSAQQYRFLPWLICAIGAIFYCYEYLLRIAPSVMTSDLMKAYHLSAGQYGELTAFYYYAYTPMQLIVGVLMDRYGPRHLLMVACLSCMAGAFLFAHSHLFPVAALGRFLIGFGSAFAFVGALKLASIWLPPERFASVSGMITALGMIGAMSGDVLMTAFVDSKGWRPTTILSAWIGVALVIFIALIVHDKVKTTRKSAYIPDLDFKDVFKGLLTCLKNRCLWFNGLIGCFMFLPISAFAELWGISYLRDAHHLTHVAASSVVSMIFLGWAIGGPLTGYLSDKLRRRKLPLIIGGCIAFVAILIILFLPINSLWLLYTLFLIFGLSTSVQVLVFAIGREVSPRHISGTAIALTNTFVMLGGAVFQPLIGILLDRLGGDQIVNGIHVFSTFSYQFALTLLPAGIFISIILATLLRETHCSLSD